MNKIFSKVWNKSLGQVVVASELARAHSGGATSTSRASAASRPKALMIGAAIALSAAVGWAPLAGADIPTGSNTHISAQGNDTGFGIGDVNRNGSTTCIAIGNKNLGGTQTGCADDYSLAVGSASQALSGSSIAMGNQATAKQTRDIAIGAGANTGTLSGGDATLQNNNIAIGASAKALGGAAIAIGSHAEATGSDTGNTNSSIAIGNSAKANDYTSVAIGDVAITHDGANYSTAVGSQAEVGEDAHGGVAVGAQAHVADGAYRATAIGSHSSATQAGGVALGRKSLADTAANVVGYAPLGKDHSGDTSGVWKSTKAAVSVGNPNPADPNDDIITRQITGVAAGTAPTDAVNVAQFQAGQTHFYSVNSTEATAGNYNNDGATGDNALAAGVDASAAGAASIAIGNDVVAKGRDRTAAEANALGGWASNPEDMAFAIGSNTTRAEGTNGTLAIGGSATATGMANMAIGTLAKAENLDTTDDNGDAVSYGGSIALGWDSHAKGHNSLAIGSNSTAVGVGNNGSTAIGPSATATGRSSLALGTLAEALDEGTIAVGWSAKATGGLGAVALGRGAWAVKEGAVALGRRSYAEAERAMALGERSDAAGTNSIAMGYLSWAKGDNSLALGSDDDAGAKTEGRNSIALGGSSVAGTKDNGEAIAIGHGATASGASAVALGHSASAIGQGAYAQGSGAKAAYDGDVAIGSGADTTTQDYQDNPGDWGAAPANNTAIGLNAKAQGGGSLAMGYGSLATGTSTTGTNNAVALGALSQALDYNATAVGESAVVNQGATNGVALGSSAVVGSDSFTSVAIGPGASVGPNAPAATALGASTQANAAGASALGSSSEASGDFSTAVGNDSHATKTWSAAVGVGSHATGSKSIAVGHTAATGDDAVSIGTSTRDQNAPVGQQYTVGGAFGNRSIAVGKDARAAGDYTLAMGSDGDAGATAEGANSIALGGASVAGTDQNGEAIAIGHGAEATGKQSVALGAGNVASNLGATAVGSNNTVSGDPAGAFGSGNTVSGNDSYAVGNDNTVSGETNYVIGHDNQVSGKDNMVLGSNVTTSGTSAVALGANTGVSTSGGVALGSQSVANTAAGVAGYDPTTGLGSTDGSATWTSTLSAVSVGGGKDGNTRQITNVAAGTQDTDAVNVAQLKSSQTHFYSVNSNDSTAGNYNNDGATGVNALAAGVNASAASNNATAMGHGAQAAVDNSTAIGNGASIIPGAGTGAGGIAIGNDALVTHDTVALPDGSVHVPKGKLGSIAIGDSAQAHYNKDTVVGAYAGHNAKRYAPNLDLATDVSDSVMFGSNAGRDSEYIYATFVGDEAGRGSIGQHNSYVGQNAGRWRDGSMNTALGSNALAGSSSTSHLDGGRNTAVGAFAGLELTGDRNTALGEYAGSKLNGIGNIAVGVNAGGSVQGNYNIASGYLGGYAVQGNNNVASGYLAGMMVKANDTVSIGTSAKGKADDAVALGSGTTASVQDGVALGSQSVANTAAGVAGYDPTTGTASTESGSVWKSTLGAVSMGKTGNTRQITNVAAGTELTDAVNVAQLQAAQDASQTHFYSVNSNDSTAGNYNNDGATGTYALAAGVGAKATGDESLAAGVGAKASGLNSIALSAGSDPGSNRKGPNFGVVEGRSSIAIMGHIVDETVNVPGTGDITLFAAQNAVAMGYSSKVGAQSDSAVAIGDTAEVGRVANRSIALGFHARVGDNATNSIAIGPEAKVDADVENALALGQGAKAHQSGNVALGSGAETADAHTGDYVIDGATTTAAGATGTGTHTVSVGTEGSERQIQNVAPGVVSETSTDAINGSQLYATNQAIDAKADDNPLTFAGDSGTDVDRKLGTKLNIKGGATDLATGDNIGVTGDDSTDTLNIQLAKDLTGLSSVTVGDTKITSDGLTIKDGPSITNKGIDAGGDKITNVAVGTDDTDAVNVSQLNDVKNTAEAGWNVAVGENGGTTNGGGTLNVGPNDTIGVDAGKNLQFDVTMNGSVPTLTASLADDITVDNVTINKNLKVEGDTKLGDNFEVTKAGDVIYNQEPDQITNDYEVVNKKYVDSQKTHYYSVKSTETGTGSNYDNDGAEGVNALAAGVKASAKGDNSVAVGTDSVASGKENTAVGNGAQATGAGYATAIGAGSIASGPGTSAVGNGNTASGNSSQAFGLSNTASGTSGSVAFGVSNKASETSAVAVGGNNKVTGLQSSAFGTLNEVDSGFSLALGDHNIINSGSTRAIAIGGENKVNGSWAVALGTQNKVSGQSSYSIGSFNTLANKNTFVLGNNVTTTQDNSVVLGNGSTDGAVHDGTTATKVTLGDTTYTYAGPASTAAGMVSVGSEGAERQIQNVAAGDVTATSTDAINGSQLYATNQAIEKTIDSGNGGGFGLTDAGGNNVKQDLGKTIKVYDPDGNITTTVNTDNGAHELQLSLGDTLVVGPAGKDGVNGSNGKAGADGTDGNPGVGIDGTDGSIGLTGPAGKDGEDGIDGVSPKLTMYPSLHPGDVEKDDTMVTRLTYKDSDGVKHHIATLEDDGLRFSGNITTGGVDADGDGESDYITRNLNDDLPIIGGAQTAGDYSSDNIKTVATQTGGIEIQLAKTPVFNGVQFGSSTGPIISNDGGNITVGDKDGNPVKITNVKKGTAPTDAVNVSQLKSHETPYFSVATQSVQDNFSNDGASGENALAAGTNTTATGDHATAVGNESSAPGAAAAAFGNKTEASGLSSVALGNLATSSNDYAVAVGNATTSTGNQAAAFGNGATASGDYSLASGNQAQSTGESAAAVGASSEAAGKQAAAFGAGAKARAFQSLAVGNFAETAATATSALAIGDHANASGEQSAAIGVSSQADGVASLAVGNNAKANGFASISVGFDSTVNGDNSGSFGDPSKIDGDNSYSVGNNNTIAAGTSDVFALGNNVNLDKNYSVALGSLSDVTVESGVALGDSSVSNTAAGVHGYDPTTGVASTDDSATWKSTWGAVSVGDVDNHKTRQITGVAAGTELTDAVNVAQLQATQIHYFSVDDDGTQASNYLNDGADGTNAIAIGPDASATAEEALALGYSATASGSSSAAVGSGAAATGNQAAAFGNVSVASGDFSTALGNNANATSKWATAVGVGSHATGSESIAMGRTAATGKDAISIGTSSRVLDPTLPIDQQFDKGGAFGNQSIAIGKEARAAKENSVALGANTIVSESDGVALGSKSAADTAAGVSGYDPTTGVASTDTSATWKSTLAAVSVGGGKDGDTRQITNVAAGTQDTDAVNVAQLVSVANANNGGGFGLTDAAGDDVMQDLSKTIKVYDPDGNITTAVNTDGGAHELQLSLGDDIAVGPGADGQNGQPGVDGEDGKPGVGINGSDGSIGLTGPAGKDGEDGIDGVSPKLTMYPSLHPGDVEKDDTMVTRLTYKDSDGVKHHIATLEDDGLRFSANDNDDTSNGYIYRHLNEEQPIVGSDANKDWSQFDKGENIMTKATGDEGKLRIALAKELTGLTSVQVGGDTGPTIGGDGNGDIKIGDPNGNPVKITNVEKGTDGNDAVNVNQLNKYVSDNTGWTVATAAKQGTSGVHNGDTSADVAANETVTFQSGNNLTVDQADKTITYALNKDLSGLDSIGIDGKDGKDGTTITVTKDGHDGIDGLNGNDGKDGKTTTRIVYTDGDGDDQQVANLNDGLVFAGDTGDDVTRKLNTTLNITGGQDDESKLSDDPNIGVVANGTDGLEIKLAKDITGIDNVTINKDLTVEGDTKLGDHFEVHKDGDVTYDGPITEGDNIVNKDYIDNNVIADGFGLTDANDNDVKQDLGKTIKIYDPDGNITTLADKTGPALKLGLANSITVGDSSGHPVTINGNDGTVSGLTNLTLPDDLSDLDGSDKAASESQLSQLSGDLQTAGLDFVGNDNQNIHKDLGDKLGIVGGMTDMTPDAASAENIRTVKNDDGELEIQLSKNLKGLDTVTVGENGAPGVDGKDGAPGVGLDGADGSIGITGKDGVDGADGIDGMDGASADITVKKGDPGVDGKDGETSTRIVYKGSDGDDHQVATLDDGLVFAGDTGDDVHKKLNETLDVTGGADTDNLSDGNIGVVAGGDDGGLEIKLAKDLTGLNTIQVGGDTGPVIGGNDDGSVTVGDKDGNPVKITNVADGDISDDSKDAINGGQLKDYVSDNTGWTVATAAKDDTSGVHNGDTSADVAANDTVTFQSGDNLTVDQNGQTITYALNKDLSGLNSITVGGGDKTVVIKDGSVTMGDTTVNNDGLTIKNGPSVTKDGIDAGGEKITNVAKGTDDTDAVNVSQLNDATNQVIDDISTKGMNFAANEGDDVHRDLGQTLAIEGKASTEGDYSGANVKTTTGKGKVNIQIAESPKFGDVTINDGGSGKVTGVADGTIAEGSKDAINGGQIYDYFKDQTNAGWDLLVDGKDKSKVAPKDSVDFTSSDGNIKITKTDKDGSHKLGFGLADDLHIKKSVTVGGDGGTTITKDGVTVGKDGPSITTDGIDAGGKRITHVAPGQEQDDAATVGQLGNVVNYFQNDVNALNSKIDHVGRTAYAGVASAMAMSGLPQAYQPGKSMGAIATSYYHGQSAMALGLSTITDNGRYVFKLNGSTNTQGDYGVSIGAGVMW